MSPNRLHNQLVTSFSIRPDGDQLCLELQVCPEEREKKKEQKREKKKNRYESLPKQLSTLTEATIKTQLLTNFPFSPSLFQKKKITFNRNQFLRIKNENENAEVSLKQRKGEAGKRRQTKAEMNEFL